MDDVFGFPISNGSGGGNFIPVVKYNSKAGRIFRVDRISTGDGFANEDIDITPSFKAIADFDNLQTGWMNFTPGQAPSFALVSLDDLKTGKVTKPDKPSDKHKDGIRFMLKLNKSCGGDRQVREIAGTASVFLTGVKEVFVQYLNERAKYPGMLPVLTLISTMPIKSAQGTNYQPAFRIDGWANRPADLVATAPSANAPPVQPLQMVQPGQPVYQPAPPVQQLRPSTGSHTVPPPNNLVAPAISGDDDFG